MTRTPGSRHGSPEDVGDEMLMALADNELDHDVADLLRKRVDADPALSARYAIFADTRSALKSAFGRQSVPDRLVSAIRTAPVATEEPPGWLSRGRGGRRHADDTENPFSRRELAQWPSATKLALAASLLIAVGVGAATGYRIGQVSGPAVGPATTADTTDPQQAARLLARTETGGTADLPGGATARVLGSFQTDLGLCRLLSIEGTGGAAERALACRSDANAEAGWRIAITINAGSEGQFAPASDLATGMIDAFLDEIGAGPLLAPEDEARALSP